MSRKVQSLQEDVAALAATVDLQAFSLERWAALIEGARYSPGDDEPENLEARLESAWTAQAAELREIGRGLRASSELRRA
jgi:hypothetical protein